MRPSFSYTLLITCFVIISSCQTNFVPKQINTQNLSVSETTNGMDSQLVHIYLPYKKILEKDMGRVISYSENEMIKDKPESELTNFLADLLLDFSVKEAKKRDLNFYPDVSYFNYGGIRVPLPKGDITVGKIFELMPFENELVFVQFNGSQLQQFFDLIAQKGGDCVGGVRFVMSNGKAKNVQVGGKSLRSESSYWVATNDYIANGGDGLNLFLQKLQMINTGIKIRDIIIASLEEKQKKGEILLGKLDGRIVNE